MTIEQQVWTEAERDRVVPNTRTIRTHAPAFPSYARVFFPVATNGARPRSWSQVFESPATPGTTWDDRRARRLGVETATGDLPAAVAGPLLRSLGGERDSIEFGYWAGHADIARPSAAFTAVLPPDDRELLFVRGAGDDLGDLAAQVGRGPMRWYPDHRRWSVTADVYDRSVVVGGDDLTIGAVLACDDLEAVRAMASLPRSALR